MKAAIYARKSNDDKRDEKNKSVTRQIEESKRYANKKGFTVEKEYIFVDDGISGAEFLDRPGLLSMMTKLDEFDAIIMSEISRLGRAASRTSIFIEDIIASNVRIFYYLTDEEEKADTLEQRMMINLKSYAAEVERAKAGERARDALVRRARNGYSTGGRIYGYDNVPVYDPASPDNTKRLYTDYKINLDEAKVIKTIFRMYSDGFGIKAIAKTLNKDPKYLIPNEKYFLGECPLPPFRKNGGWAPTCVREILYRKKYIGIIEYGKTKRIRKGGSTKNRINNSPEKIITTERKDLRIIDDELWEDVSMRLLEMRQIYLRDNSGHLKGKPESSRRSKYLLSGLGKCSSCGGNIVHVGGYRNTHYYGCSYRSNRGSKICDNDYRIRAEKLENSLLQKVEELALSPDAIEKIVDSAYSLIKKQNAHNPNQTQELKNKISRLENELNNLIDSTVKGRAPKRLLEEIKIREEKINSLQNRINNDHALKNFELDEAEIKKVLRKNAKSFNKLIYSNVPKARQALKKILDGPIIFEPVLVNGEKSYAFKAKTNLGKVLTFDGIYKDGVPNSLSALNDLINTTIYGSSKV